MTDWAMSDKTHVTETNPAGLVRTEPHEDSVGYKLIRLQHEVGTLEHVLELQTERISELKEENARLKALVWVAEQNELRFNARAQEVTQLEAQVKTLREAINEMLNPDRGQGFTFCNPIACEKARAALAATEPK